VGVSPRRRARDSLYDQRLFRFAFIAALCASLTVGHRGQVRAEEELSPQVRSARAHYHAGQAYFRQGELERALAEFQASARDDARPELDYNIGLTCDRLGDATRAIDAYRKFLAARPDVAERSEIEARMLALERAVGELQIDSRMRGASVTLDGVLLDAGHLGQPIRVNAGRHEIVARKEALLTQQRTVEAEARKRTVIEIDPREPERGLDRRAKLGIGLGVSGALLVVAGVALGVYFGTRSPSPFDPGGAAGVVSVRPLALGVAP